MVAKPFGTETLEEKDAIRAELLAAGHPDQHPDLFFAVEREWERRHVGKPGMRERQEWHAFQRRMLAPHRQRSTLTTEELAYLVDKLDGVNDPLGQRARAVLAAMLDQRARR